MGHRVLVVGGIDADRNRAQQALAAAGYETDGVSDGAEAFEQLMALPYDLVITDCHLAKLDCAAMVQKVRGLGVKTPIWVWAEAADRCALGHEAIAVAGRYLDRSSPIELLVDQVDVALRQSVQPPAPPAITVPTNKIESPASGGVLLIDERAGEAETLRLLLPPSTHLVSCESANQGQAQAHKHKFDLVLFSADTSITNLTGTIAQLHLLLPEGFIVGVATAVRGSDPQSAVKALRDLDFDEVILKPFKADNVNRLVARYCSSWDDLVVVSGDLVRASARCSRKEAYKDYVATLKTRLEQGVRALIDGCFDRAVVDLSAVDTLSPMDLGELLRRLTHVAAPFGLSIKFVLTPALIAVLCKFCSSFGWEPFDLVPSVEAARAAMA